MTQTTGRPVAEFHFDRCEPLGDMEWSLRAEAMKRGEIHIALASYWSEGAAGSLPGSQAEFEQSHFAALAGEVVVDILEWVRAVGGIGATELLVAKALEYLADSRSARQ